MQELTRKLKRHTLEQQTLESVPLGSPRNPAPESKRKKWQNCIGNEIVEPLLYVKPQTLDELVESVVYAQTNNCKVKAVGSGHSFSDIVQTADVLVNCHGLKNPIPLDKDLLYDEDMLKDRDYNLKHLVQVENGITIRDLNRHLDRNGLALENMGGYDAQTIAGVVSTSTHGTGITLGPIASSVVSIVLVGEWGKIYRIEPSAGITNPQKYKTRFPTNELIQDDDVFNAVLVSMGCMGIIYSFILKVRDAFLLCEERDKDTTSVWEELREGGKIKQLLEKNRHLEIWVNPYAIEGKHGCLITKRNVYTGNPNTLTPGQRMRRWLVEELLLTFKTLPALVFKLFYKKTPKLIAGSMKTVLDDDGYVGKSYKVMNLGNANQVKGYSAEYAVSLEDDQFIKAVDKILELAKRNQEVGDIYHTAPISLRFVKRCDAFLSMMNGEDKCLIEVPLLVGTKGRYQILDKIEHELLKLGQIRPHWGQYHNLGKDTIAALYPDLGKWLKVYEQMNKSRIFSNTFTNRCGFDH
jgi:hypothetical protein